MNTAADIAVRDFCNTCLRLRGDLTFTPRADAGQRYYLVEDPLNSRFFRMGTIEAHFVNLLDGTRTFQEAFSQLATQYPGHGLTQLDLVGLCRWLVELELAHTHATRSAERLTERSEQATGKRWLARLNPLHLRIPLGRPDATFDRLNRWLGWSVSPLATGLTLLLLTIAGYHLHSQWPRFLSSGEGILAPDNWLGMLGCWVLLKVLHEIGHGLACRRYGGTVREAGVQLVLLAPLAYVDVTSSWRFPSRWQRIHVAAAGMYMEWIVAAAAALLWSHTEPGTLQRLCYNVTIMAGIATLLFNANPLMKFDGYYIFADLLGLENLAARAHQYLSYWCRRYLCGIPLRPPEGTPYEVTWIRIYAWCALAWRGFVGLGMMITAVALLQGAGIVLAGLMAILWYLLPAFRFTGYLFEGRPGEQPQRGRFALITLTAATFLVVTLGMVPWPASHTAPAVVVFAPETTLRAGEDGFVREILVQSGETVEAGQVLLRLENQALMRQAADLALQLQQSQLRQRQHQTKGELALHQAEVEQAAALAQQADELRRRIDSLVIRSPHAGTIVARDLAASSGKYLHRGDVVLRIGDESRKELQLSLEQEDVSNFSKRVGGRVWVDVPRQPLGHALLEKIEPRASQEIPHEALVTTGGGRISVRRVHSESPHSEFELLQPRFRGTLTLPPQWSGALRAGQTATISFTDFDRAIGPHLYCLIERWIRERLSAKPAS